MGDGLLIKTTEQGSFLPAVSLGNAGEIGDAMTPEAFRKGLEPSHETPHEATKRVPTRGRVVVDKNHPATRHDARQERVDDGAFTLVWNFVEQKEAGDSIIHAMAGMGCISDSNMGLRESSKLATAQRHLQRHQVYDIEPSAAAHPTRQFRNETAVDMGRMQHPLTGLDL